MIKIAESKHKIKTLKPGDNNWYIDSNFIRTPRAGFEISINCPNNYREVIEQCVNFGWLKPVAYMKDTEYMWEQLQK
jgi:hypothetical protein